jgi:hypothetical protein
MDRQDWRRPRARLRHAMLSYERPYWGDFGPQYHLVMRSLRSSRIAWNWLAIIHSFLPERDTA